MLHAAIVILCATAAPAAHAATIAPGNYVFEGGNGELTIKAARSDGQPFSINTMGGNAHSCGLEGVVKANKAVVGDSACTLSFEVVGTTIEVKIQEAAEACRAYCGMRAGFTGNYLKPQPECVPSRVKTERDRFKALFGARSFGKARDELLPIVEKCEKVVSVFDWYWILNDLAVTLHDLDDDAGCLKLLAPLQEFAAERDDEIGTGEPAYADVQRKIAKATRFNLELCSKQRAPAATQNPGQPKKAP
jgi:hypothetical protein